MKTIPWFPVGTENPPPDRPGEYEVRFTWPGSPVMKIRWDGKEWGRIGMFKPSRSWGDHWRGVLA
jgi:hypothetical protein